MSEQIYTGVKMEKTTWIALVDEYEGDAPLYFDLSQPERLADYLIHNVERNEKRRFFVRDMAPAEVAELSTDEP